MVIAPVGHTSEHIPQPLQYSRLTVGGTVLVITASGQKVQHLKQDGIPLFAGVHIA